MMDELSNNRENFFAILLKLIQEQTVQTLPVLRRPRTMWFSVSKKNRHSGGFFFTFFFQSSFLPGNLLLPSFDLIF